MKTLRLAPRHERMSATNRYRLAMAAFVAGHVAMTLSLGLIGSPS